MDRRKRVKHHFGGVHGVVHVDLLSSSPRARIVKFASTSSPIVPLVNVSKGRRVTLGDSKGQNTYLFLYTRARLIRW